MEALGLSFKNMNELNAKIDKHIPNLRPRFERKEILVGGEVFEVYFQDVIECVRALFGDQEFAPYLVLAPEKHYVDDKKECCMFHDMHTGRWWWATQVRSKIAGVKRNLM